MDLPEDLDYSHKLDNIMDNENIKTYKESNVTDFTNSPDEFCETEPKIKLNSAIDIRYDLYEMKLWMGIGVIKAKKSAFQ